MLKVQFVIWASVGLQELQLIGYSTNTIYDIDWLILSNIQEQLLNYNLQTMLSKRDDIVYCTIDNKRFRQR